jgi:Mn-containing catalase
MILRVDRLQVELPAPSDPDPAAAAHVQELLGGRFGEMSTLMNYTYQSFNFRGRRKVKPFYDLIANIATEEFGHIELVSAVINGLLTGASKGEDVTDSPLKPLKDNEGLRHHYINAGLGALPVNSLGQGWNGEYVFNSGDLVLDLLHNFFLENGARMAKIRVYETTDHPIARRMLGYLFVRGGVHALAYAKALEGAHGRRRQADAADPGHPGRRLQGGARVHRPRAARQALPVLGDRLRGHPAGLDRHPSARRHAASGCRRSARDRGRSGRPAGGGRRLRPRSAPRRARRGGPADDEEHQVIKALARASECE